MMGVIAQASDAVRRARYRRARLRQLPAVEMSEPSASGENFRWLPDFRAGLRSRPALECRPDSRVAYDVVLPRDASVFSWCAVATSELPARAEFEIRIRTERFESCERRTVDATRTGPRWESLCVRTPEDGPARIALSARLTRGEPTGVRLLWGDPGIEAPRPMADFRRAILAAITDRGLRNLWHKALPADDERLYRLWVREHEPSREAWREQRQWSLGRPSLFSLLTFVAEPGEWRPERTAASLQKQSYPGWEWLIVSADKPSDTLAARAGSDPRLRVLSVPAGSTRADGWNAALQEARGEFVAVLGAADALSPTALCEMALAIERLPVSDLLYSDEDRLSSTNRRHDPRFKPDWSPELLLSYNYIGRLAMIRRDAAMAAGAFRHGSENAEEWDLFLRLSRSGARIRRVPRCLYHRSDDEGGVEPSQADAVLRAHGEALLLPVTVTTSGGLSRVVWDTKRQPMVSIVVPNRDASRIFRQCAGGILERTSYSNCELVIVDNGSTEPEVLDLYRLLEQSGRARVVAFNRPFNFSAACNTGAAAARGDVLLFLNNDIEVIEPDWLDELVRWAQLPHVGIVGAKLLYPDRTIQHAGVVFGLGLVGHIFSRAHEGTSGLFGPPDAYRNYLAVTGACQMMRREVFERLGGYDERFRLSFSDIVLCMEAWRTGYRVVYTPYARLVHYESFTRKRDDSVRDMELLAEYLQSRGFLEDPYCHPELNPRSLVPALRPPFDPVPQQVIHDYLKRVLSPAAAASIRGIGYANIESDDTLARDHVSGSSSAS
jgi:GT2 family glycosyltransferase